jgi:type II secretion system protein G
MKKGFTLIELLVVVAILGILSMISFASFKTVQMRGRDAQRKSDLKQIANSLELYNQDYKVYPAQATITTLLANGGEFKDTNTLYMKKMPMDPAGNATYVYRRSTSGSMYQLFAHLENSEDKNIIAGITYNCPTVALPCNFAVTSANASATEILP